MRRNGNRPCVRRTGERPPKIEAGRAISIPGRRRESLQVCKQQRESVCVVRLCFPPQDITGNMTLEQPSLFLCIFQYLIFCMQIGSCCTSYLGFLLYLFANSQHGVSILPGASPKVSCHLLTGTSGTQWPHLDKMLNKRVLSSSLWVQISMGGYTSYISYSPFLPYR